MMQSLKVGIIALICSMTFLVGCSEGPAEKHGEKIDNTLENISDTIQDKGAAQKAGEKLDEITE